MHDALIEILKAEALKHGTRLLQEGLDVLIDYIQNGKEVTNEDLLNILNTIHDAS